MTKSPTKFASQDSEGLRSRWAALEALEGVLENRRTINIALDNATGWKKLKSEDRAFAKFLILQTVRHLPEIDQIYSNFLSRPLPRRTHRLKHLLRLGTAQLVFLKTPPHAAVNTTVALAEQLLSQKFKGLVNALLRKIARSSGRLSPDKSARINTPDWLWKSWRKTYGEENTLKIAQQHLELAPTDLTVAKTSPELASHLNAETLESGSLRCRDFGNPADWWGYADGRWWVQDAAAALPIKLIGDVRGLNVIDLCAAPGGKTAQLALGGANVVSLDSSKLRSETLKANMKRLGLTSNTIVSDLRDWEPSITADLVVLDAPCTATGTCRRHPEILRLRCSEDVHKMVRIQKNLLDAGAAMVPNGGTLLYITCSLQPEEGPDQVTDFLNRWTNFARSPFKPLTWKGLEGVIDMNGALRTLPFHWSSRGGMDGFFAAALKRIS